MNKLFLHFVLFIIIIQIKTFSQSENYNFETYVHGYGELHYNYEKVGNKPLKSLLDFHRFVTFIGYTWNDKWSFHSELELEHNYVEEGQGELELEQAYVNFHFKDWLGFQAGVVLPSVGLINEIHEPPLFFGVERPDYNTRIIPTTWAGNGIAFYGRINSFDYKVTIMEGLNSEKFSESNAIRDARRKGFKADARNLLYNFRIDYLGVSSLKIGGSFTYNKANGDTSSNKIYIYEFHGRYQTNRVDAIFEYGTIDYEKYNLQKSQGFYFDFGYNISADLDWETKIIPFIRYSDYNTAAKTLAGGDSEKKNHFKYWMIGLSVKPVDNVVLKIDYGIRTRELGNEKTKLFNLGIGYMF
ncbi:porin [Rosettibacter firmus]|uniref:porin n=1 Tax=Rosettibacter firmus TaxID=3111522 RepID=UPI00336C29C5